MNNPFQHIATLFMLVLPVLVANPQTLFAQEGTPPPPRTDAVSSTTVAAEIDLHQTAPPIDTREYLQSSTAVERIPHCYTNPQGFPNPEGYNNGYHKMHLLP